MDFGELKELIRILEDSSLAELEIEQDDRRIRLSKQTSGMMMAQPAMHPAPAPSAAPAGGPAPDASGEEDAVDEGLLMVESPMVGTFYSAPAPGEDPFIKPGDTVAADTTVCIVEAMKIMNEVAAKVSGKVERVLVENGDPVEFGQPLFAVRPNA